MVMLTARVIYGGGKEFLDILKILHNLKYCHEIFYGKITLFFKRCLHSTKTNANDCFKSRANKMKFLTVSNYQFSLLVSKLTNNM